MIAEPSYPILCPRDSHEPDAKGRHCQDADDSNSSDGPLGSDRQYPDQSDDYGQSASAKDDGTSYGARPCPGSRLRWVPHHLVEDSPVDDRHCRGPKRCPWTTGHAEADGYDDEAEDCNPEQDLWAFHSRMLRGRRFSTSTPTPAPSLR